MGSGQGGFLIPGLRTKLWRHQEEAVTFADGRPGTYVAAGMGCISGDAIIVTNRASITRNMPLRRAFELWSDGNWTNPWHCRSLKNDRFGQNLILGIVSQGMREVVRVQMLDGRSLDCTPDHEILTVDGWRPAGDLKSGDKLMMNGELVCADCGKELAPSNRRKRPFCYSCSRQGRNNPKFGIPFKDKDGYMRMAAPGHPRANRSNHVYQHILVMEQAIGRLISIDENVHHVNQNRSDNRLENLELLPSSEHKRRHDPVMHLHGGSTINGGRVMLIPEALEVSSVSPAGEIDVYDIKMTAPHHNFVANGFVVHNCGKSATAIAFAQKIGAQRVLLMCPLSVVGVWPGQVERHSELPWFVQRLDSGGVREKTEVAEIALALGRNRPTMLVVNHESVWREPFRKLALSIKWDIAIVDELHKGKASGGSFSRFLYLLSKRVPVRLGLSGTPMPHSPLDIYAQARFLDPEIFGTSFVRFKHRYAVLGGWQDRQVVAYQNMPEFEEKLGSFMHRVKKEDVLDLPPEVDEERRCRLEPKAQRIYDSIEATMVAQLETGVLTASNSLVKLLRLEQLTGGDLTTDEGTCEIISTAKTLLLSDVLDEIPKEIPVIIFARFVADLNRARAAGEAAGRRVGELSGRLKDGLTEQATMREDIDLLVTQIQSGGVGVDLSRASVAIYYSTGFNLGDVLQARSRPHRPGQTRTVTHIRLIVEKTIDELITKALDKRENLIESVLEGMKRRKTSGDMGTY